MCVLLLAVEYDNLKIDFSTNRQGQWKGFSCSVSCGEAPPATTLEPATTDMSSDCECGLPNRVKRIVGGVETETNEYPWQVREWSRFKNIISLFFIPGWCFFSIQ